MTTLTEFDRIITVNGAEGGKIVGIQLAIGEYAEEGINGDLLTFYMLEHNFPEEACKNLDYFMTNYWYDMSAGDFVKVKSEKPNDYAIYESETETWTWDAASVLTDIRRERDGRLGRSDWTQLSDTNLTADQKAEAVNYRRALRDITIDIGNPANTAAVDWPTPPSFLA